MSAARAATPALTVTEVLATFPRAAVIFEVFGIDMCCSQSRTLAAAASAAHIDIGDVVDLIEGREVMSISPPGRNASLPDLTRYIVMHFHRRARAVLVELTELSRQICSGHGEPAFREVKDAVEQLVQELVPHMRDEERYHFRYIASMESPAPDREVLVPLYGTLKFPLQALKHDHSRDLTAMSDLRAIMGEFVPPAGSCDRVQRLYHLLAMFELELSEHVQIEDGTLFPLAIETERRLSQVEGAGFALMPVCG